MPPDTKQIVVDRIRRFGPLTVKQLHAQTGLHETYINKSIRANGDVLVEVPSTGKASLWKYKE